METEDRKWKWINCAFYLDEPFEDGEIQEAMKDEFVRRDLLRIIEVLKQVN